MIERYTLKNGIPVFIVETHASPVVSIQAWVTRGSIHETDALAGISHFLEHALFKGTKQRKVGEIALEIESHGGEINAFTSFEETAYYATLASRYFDVGLDIIADAVQHPSFDATEMLREREVILEEIKRAYDSPARVVSMSLWKAMFAGTQYGRPVLGYESTVSKINHQKLKRYFEKNYHAGTLSVIVVGDVEKEKVLEKVTEKFGRAARRSDRTPKLGELKIPRRSLPQVLTSAKDINECHIQIGFPSPAMGNRLIPALDLMCSAIGQGESSRLYQRLIREKKLAMEAYLGLVATSHCGMASLGLLVAPENIVPAVKEALNVVREVLEKGLTQEETERVKTSLESEVTYGKETVEAYARRLGYYYVQFGDPDYESKYLQALLATSRDQAVNAFSEVMSRPPVISIVHPTTAAPDKKALANLFVPSQKRRPAPPAPVSGPLKKESGSIRYITKRVDALPVTAVRILFPGGTREEDTSKLGLGNLFYRMWTSGTKNYSSLQIAKKLESLGASVQALCGKNTLGLSLEFLSKHWPEVKPIVQQVLLSPSFPEDELITERELILREILAEKDAPGQLCHLNFLSTLYGNHPYGRSSLGKRETVTNLTREDLRKFYSDYVHQGRMVLSSVGDFETESWIRELQELSSALPASGKTLRESYAVDRPNHLRIVTEKKAPLFQSHILVGFLGASFRDSDRYALKILSSALAGQGGRLFLELRDRQSLAYQVSPMNSDSPDPGVFGFYIGCSCEKLETALIGIRSELQKILDKALTSKELARAKEFWLGRSELEMQRYSSQAMLFGLDELYGLGFRHSLETPQRIKSITAKDIQSAALKYLKPEHATISIVHPEPIDSDRIKQLWLQSFPKRRPSRASVVLESMA